MNSIEQGALTNFKNGYNCAQAVLSAFTEKFNYNDELAIAVSAGFGAGMARQQKTCGAVTGAYMALGIAISRNETDNAERKKKTYQIIQQFNEKFFKEHKSLNCSNLLGQDISTQEGYEIAKEKNLFDVVCNKCVITAVNLVSELTSK